MMTHADISKGVPMDHVKKYTEDQNRFDFRDKQRFTPLT